MTLDPDFPEAFLVLLDHGSDLPEKLLGWLRQLVAVVLEDDLVAYLDLTLRENHPGRGGDELHDGPRLGLLDDDSLHDHRSCRCGGRRDSSVLDCFRLRKGIARNRRESQPEEK